MNALSRSSGILARRIYPHDSVQSIPLTIFQDLENPDPALHAQAWAAALVLVTFVLVISILSKVALARSRRKLAR